MYSKGCGSSSLPRGIEKFGARFKFSEESMIRNIRLVLSLALICASLCACKRSMTDYAGTADKKGDPEQSREMDRNKPGDAAK